MTKLNINDPVLFLQYLTDYPTNSSQSAVISALGINVDGLSLPVDGSIILQDKISILTYFNTDNLDIDAQKFPHIQKIYTPSADGNSFLSYDKNSLSKYNTILYLEPLKTYLIYTDGVPFKLYETLENFSTFNTANFNNGAKWNSVIGNITTVGTNGSYSYYGIYDMNGNVSEWVDDIMNNYYKSHMGGSYLSNLNDLLITSENIVNLETSTPYLGFRIASSSNIYNYKFFVQIDDVDNIYHNDTEYGSVSYSYKLNKYLVTNQDYCDFLNNTSKTDNYNTYNINMGINNIGGIFRLGDNGNYAYFVKPCMGNKPVVFISWYNAARYCNWLHNNKPNSGIQNDNSTEDGSYTLHGIMDHISIIPKNDNSLYWIPTKDEWVKAAYYNGNDAYFKYATQSNDDPYSVNSGFYGDGPYCAFNDDINCVSCEPTVDANNTTSIPTDNIIESSCTK